MSEPKGSETPRTDALLVRTKAMSVDRAGLIDHARELETAQRSAEKERDEAVHNQTTLTGIAVVNKREAEQQHDRAERLEAALKEINALDAEKTDEGCNEWGEALCFRAAQEIAYSALSKGAQEGEA